MPAIDGALVGMWLTACSFLGFLMICGAVVHADVTRRRIPGSLCVMLALLGVVHALGAEGLPGLSGLVVRAGVALLVALPLMAAFCLRRIGGGDIKLISALLLWVPLPDVPPMLFATVFAGAFLALSLKLLSRTFAFVRGDTVPYGAAIVAGGLFVLAPPFAALAKATCALAA